MLANVSGTPLLMILTALALFCYRQLPMAAAVTHTAAARHGRSCFGVENILNQNDIYDIHSKTYILYNFSDLYPFQQMDG